MFMLEPLGTTLNIVKGGTCAACAVKLVDVTLLVGPSTLVVAVSVNVPAGTVRLPNCASPLALVLFLNVPATPPGVDEMVMGLARMVMGTLDESSACAFVRPGLNEAHVACVGLSDVRRQPLDRRVRGVMDRDGHLHRVISIGQHVARRVEVDARVGLRRHRDEVDHARAAADIEAAGL